ncbi:E3 ubiquitin-protein ligase MARCHF11-like isoform X2 [Bacillus rossius redtenbacheri]|uniref:E3 ubiquitin-protein ligase MARCHF11-like isoform X2 n=1 Tax=Bacillus rossius redtenbacheri TaxID=93214 RepID=UPI002FDE5A2E
MADIMGFINRMFKSAIERVTMHGPGRNTDEVDAASGENFTVVGARRDLGRALKVPTCRALQVPTCGPRSEPSPQQSLDSTATRQQLTDGSELEEVCRICHGSQGRLRSLCGCRGSVRLVHGDCLKKWLDVSGSSCCELCRRRYLLSVEPRYWLLQSVWVWLSTEVSPWQIVTSQASWLLELCACHILACWLARAVRKGENQLVDRQNWYAPAVAGLLRLLVRVYQLERSAMFLEAAAWLVHSWYLWWLTTFDVGACDPLDSPLTADASFEDID